MFWKCSISTCFPFQLVLEVFHFNMFSVPTGLLTLVWFGAQRMSVDDVVGVRFGNLIMKSDGGWSVALVIGDMKRLAP